MKSAAPGPSISPVEVTNVSPHGFWLFVAVESIEHPEKYPLVSQAQSNERLQPTKASRRSAKNRAHSARLGG
ncbi:MAG: hypothetical protein HYX76_05370 [Acidobacteria bacterium]|nr:hypothetical protein [Acidobacteriota bacterium]